MLWGAEMTDGEAIGIAVLGTVVCVVIAWLWREIGKLDNWFEELQCSWGDQPALPVEVIWQDKSQAALEDGVDWHHQDDYHEAFEKAARG